MYAWIVAFVKDNIVISSKSEGTLGLTSTPIVDGFRLADNNRDL
jgi:hypothetical protein